jgi:hypothetical protein
MSRARPIGAATGHNSLPGRGKNSLFAGFCFLEDPTLSGAGEDYFRGLYYEVSLALVGVASPAYFQY